MWVGPVAIPNDGAHPYHSANGIVVATTVESLIEDPIDQPQKAQSSAVRFFVSRVLQGIGVIWAAITAVFIAIHLTPGDTADTLLGENRNDPALRAQVTEQWGLDDSFIVQYLSYFGRLLTGDLGTSYTQYREVTTIFAEQLPATIKLASLSLLLVFVMAVGLAWLTAGQTGFARKVSQTLELIVLSTPAFWIGIVLLAIFSFNLGWFPVAGDDGIKSLMLPAIALAIPNGAYLTQIMRDGMDRALEQPFALTARARGLSVNQVKTHHALRHAALPTLTVGGMTAGALLGGTVIVESVFSRPGLGQITLVAVDNRDMPLLLGITFVSALIFVAISIFVDFLYAVIDPRLKARRR